ncbi:hypothetical protein EV184_12684 [Sinorhizobium americanum]|uniref:Uncharacterized protein n=1 Tax=Sinorhizobium americanum TaxID=194963 RepID=A0A4R2B3V5_9HYPH|nr:hypothetical protein EV184_12684 [Sinorhizobium americanum]
MNAHRTEIEAGHALAISIWENEGGTSAPKLMDDQYGRRIEAHRPLAIYHVSAGSWLRAAVTRPMSPSSTRSGSTS